MIRRVEPVHQLRQQAGLTQGDLARLSGTSQSTVAAYEAGRKSPTWRTLKRLVAAANLEAHIRFVAPTTREDRRSLFLHRAIALRLLDAPQDVVRRAKRNLRLMAAGHPEASDLLAEWRRILSRPVGEIVDAMLDPGLRARDLRQVTPFAGVLSAAERAQVYRRFRDAETKAA